MEAFGFRVIRGNSGRRCGPDRLPLIRGTMATMHDPPHLGEEWRNARIEKQRLERRLALLKLGAY